MAVCIFRATNPPNNFGEMSLYFRPFLSSTELVGKRKDHGKGSLVTGMTTGVGMGRGATKLHLV